LEELSNAVDRVGELLVSIPGIEGFVGAGISGSSLLGACALRYNLPALFVRKRGEAQSAHFFKTVDARWLGYPVTRLLFLDDCIDTGETLRLCLGAAATQGAKVLAGFLSTSYMPVERENLVIYPPSARFTTKAVDVVRDWLRGEPLPGE
jgi:adenine/guanine phosphoribosyltransferase-like PRPP-binding protein